MKKSVLLSMLSLAPLLVLVIKIYNYGLFFPFWDAWHLAPLIEKSFCGTLSAADLWELHNGHRLFVSKALMVLIARISGWQVVYELVLSVVLALLSLLLIFKMCLCSIGTSWRRSPLWLLPLLSMLIFSWAQMENWVWGWQFLIFLSVAAVIAGFALLSDERLGWLRFFFAIILGIVASFSFGSGLVYWIAAIPLLVGNSDETRNRKIIRMLLWLLASMLTFKLFFLDYPGAGEWGPAASSALADPAQYVLFVLLEIGNPIAGFFLTPVQMNSDVTGRAHYIVGSGLGVLGLAAFVSLSWFLVKRSGFSISRLAPLFALAAFAVGSAMLAGLGRSVVGLHQALSSRYITLATLFWCALAGLIASVLMSHFQMRMTRMRILIVSVVFVIAQFSVFHVNARWEEITGWKRLAWTSLRAGNESPIFANQLFFPGDRLVREFLPIAKKRGLLGLNAEINAEPEVVAEFFNIAVRAAEENQIEAARAYLRTTLILAPNHEAALKLETRLNQTGASLQ